MKIKDISPENRPRERLQLQGPSALSNAELLALILKSGTKKENVLEICNKLISKYSLDGLAQATLPELIQEHGIGKAKACQIVALFELYKRTKSVQREKLQIKSAQDIANIYLPKLQPLNKEQFVVVYLDARNRIISDEIITLGTVNASLIHPREVFHGAIKNLASAIIVIHNHPSGDPTPSKEDLEITQRLEQTSKIVGIRLLDHLIIGKTYWSYKNQESFKNNSSKM